MSEGPGRKKGIIIGLVVIFSVGVLTFFMQHTGDKKKIESEWYDVNSLEPREFSASDKRKLSLPIGPLSGTWGGDFNGYLVKIDFDPTPGSIHVYGENDDIEPFNSISSPFKRKGRIITTGVVSCLKVISSRETSFIRSGCPIIRSHATYELRINNRDSITLVGENEKIKMSRI